MGNLIDSLLFQPPPPSRLKESKIVWLKTSRGKRIPAFHIDYNNGVSSRSAKAPEVGASSKASRQPITLLYSHANAEDLGNIYPWCKFLCKQLKVNVFAYDYTGYGLATGQGPPSESNCYADIDAAYSYLRNVLKIPASSIVLYGRSLGSGPSCYLAARTSGPTEDTVGGLILHAPFLSVFRIVIESGCTLVGDQFPNVDICSSIQTPVLVIHGRKDKVVPFSHAECLLKNINVKYRVPPLYIDEMGHNNVQVSVRAFFVQHLKNYLQDLIRREPLSGTKFMARLPPPQTVGNGVDYYRSQHCTF